MASRARGDEDKPFLINPVDEQPIRLDMALAVPAVCPTQRVISYSLGQNLPAHERLENRLELGEVLALLLDALVVPLELRGNLNSIMAYSSSRAAIASLTVR